MEGGREQLRATAAKGGAATAAKFFQMEGFRPGELPRLQDAGAEEFIDVVNQAFGEGRISHQAHTALMKSPDVYTRAREASLKEELVTKLRETLAAKEREIAELRRQLGLRPNMKVAP
jgi:hypothetical protein